MISNDENENSTYKLKEDMIYLPEHPEQVFKTEVRQEYLEVVKRSHQSKGGTSK